MASYRHIITVFLLMRIAFSSASLPSCPNGNDNLFEASSTCFEFARFDEMNLQQQPNIAVEQVASNYCKKRGKQLAAVRSPQEHLFVSQIARKLDYDQVVIGLRKRHTLWKWVGGKWFQPLATQGCFLAPANNRDSVDFIDSYLMSRDVCFEFCRGQSGYRFASLSGNKCKCLKSFDWTVSSSSCTHRCSGNKAELCGSLDNMAENVFQFRQIERDFGIVINADESQRERGKRLEWQRNFPPFDKMRPGQKMSPEYCAYVENTETNDNFWQTAKCSISLPFLCQLPYQQYKVVMSTYERYIWSARYVYVLIENKSLPFDRANEFCRSIYGHLASIDSAQVHDLICNLFKSRPMFQFKMANLTTSRRYTYKFWIGASASNYVFPDGTSQEPFDAWTDEFDSYWHKYREDCVEMSSLHSKNKAAYLWHPIRCDTIATYAQSSLAFLCSGPTREEFNASGFAKIIRKDQRFGGHYYQNQIIGKRVRRYGPINMTEPKPTRLELTVVTGKGADNSNDTGYSTGGSLVEAAASRLTEEIVQLRERLQLVNWNNSNLADSGNSSRQVSKDETGLGGDDDDEDAVPGWGIALVVIVLILFIAVIVLILIVLYSFGSFECCQNRPRIDQVSDSSSLNIRLPSK